MNCVASSHQNHLDYAFGLCRFVAINRSRSVAVIGYGSNHDSNILPPSNASNSIVAWGNVLEAFLLVLPTLSPSLNDGGELQLPRLSLISP